MFLIIGLGNTGAEYATTRHNAGWMALDSLVEANAVWLFNKKFNAEITETKRGRKKIIFAKPQTFMNESGHAAMALANFYRITPDHIIVLHDDVDFPLGTIKLQRNRSAAGHKGVQSVIDALGTKNFYRVRIGIGKSAVLKKFSKEELAQINAAFDKIRTLVETAIT